MACGCTRVDQIWKVSGQVTLQNFLFFRHFNLRKKTKQTAWVATDITNRQCKVMQLSFLDHGLLIRNVCNLLQVPLSLEINQRKANLLGGNFFFPFFCWGIWHLATRGMQELTTSYNTFNGNIFLQNATKCTTKATEWSSKEIPWIIQNCASIKLRKYSL